MPKRLARFRATALGVLLIASAGAWLQACGGSNTGGGGGAGGNTGAAGSAGSAGSSGSSGTTGGGGAGGSGNGGGAGTCGGAGGDSGGGASCAPCAKADSCCYELTAFIGISSSSCRYSTNCEAKSGCDRDQYIATCTQSVLDAAQAAPQLPACQ